MRPNTARSQAKTAPIINGAGDDRTGQQAPRTDAQRECGFRIRDARRIPGNASHVRTHDGKRHEISTKDIDLAKTARPREIQLMDFSRPLSGSQGYRLSSLLQTGYAPIWAEHPVGDSPSDPLQSQQSVAVAASDAGVNRRNPEYVWHTRDGQ